MGDFSSSGYVNPGGTSSGSGLATTTSMGYTDGYPKVVGIAIRFLDGKIEESVEFTNPNIVDSPITPQR
jgi:hypothetical protein